MICVEKGKALDDIRGHLLVHGSQCWRGVRANYPAVTEASWWRWVREVKEQLKSQQLWMPAARGRARNAIGCEPGGSSAAIGVAPYGDGPGSRIDYSAALRGQFADVRAMRERSLNADGSIRDVHLFGRSISMNMRILNRAVKLEREIRQVEGLRRLSDSILAEVALADPALQRRVVDRLTMLAAQSAGR